MSFENPYVVVVLILFGCGYWVVDQAREPFQRVAHVVTFGKAFDYVYECESDGDLVERRDIVKAAGCPTWGMHNEGTNERGEIVGGCVHRMTRKMYHDMGGAK